MNRTVDLSGQAVALAGIAASIATGGTGLTALRASSTVLLATVAGFSTAPESFEPGQFAAMIDGDGCLAVGPGLQLIVDGPLVAPRQIHVIVGDRALTVMTGGSGMHVRLIDGVEVIADATFPPLGAAVDHLDLDATMARARERISRALDNRAGDPVDGPEPTALADSGGGASGGLAASAAGLSGGIGGRAAMAVAGVATAAAAAALASRRREQPVWACTHVTPPSGIDARPEPDPMQPATRVDAGVELRLIERSGDWAHVDASNGWSGWVDFRLLVDQTGV